MKSDNTGGFLDGVSIRPTEGGPRGGATARPGQDNIGFPTEVGARGGDQTQLDMASWFQNLVKSSFSWKNLIGQDGPVPQLCRAWVVFDGTQANGLLTLLDSFNVTSVTKTATGRYTMVVTVPFANANYAVCPCANDSVSNTIQYVDSTISKTTTSVSIVNRSPGGADQNASFVSIVLFGRQ